MAAALFLSFPAPVAAQTVVDAQRVEFTPSADHDASTGGVAHVTRYLLQIFAAGGSQVVQSVDLGKPAPEADGMIRVNFVQLLSTPLTPGQQYESRVVAVGPGGTSSSAVSNQFSFSPTCVPSLPAAAATVPAVASSGSVGLSVAVGCLWTASSSASWLTVTSAAGSGPATIGYSAAANSSATPRTAVLTIAGLTHSVTQSGAVCSYSLSPTSHSASASGGSPSVAVSAGTSCAWSASSSASWLTIASGASGSGNGTVGFNVAANTSPTARTGTATIAGQTFTVTQAAAACTYAISPASATVGASASSASVTVTAGTSCAWNASSSASWLTIASGASGSGNGTVGINVAANTSTASRTGTATIAGQTFTVTQAAAACTYAISPVNRTSVAAGETVTVAVTAGGGCPWTAASNAAWMSVPAGSGGTGNGSVTVAIAANPTAGVRSGTVNIAGRSFTVSQPGQSCSYQVTPTTVSAAFGGQTSTLAVTAGTGCAWATSGLPSWIGASGGTGTGNGTVSITIAPSSGTTTRTATFTIAGRQVTVSQPASGAPSIPSGVRLVPSASP